jgi:hypothetical protein
MAGSPELVLELAVACALRACAVLLSPKQSTLTLHFSFGHSVDPLANGRRREVGFYGRGEVW